MHMWQKVDLGGYHVGVINASRDAMETTLRLCWLEKAVISVIRAIVPSGFINSHKTAALWNPAISTMASEASVWPCRAVRPCGWARRGKMCPGMAISSEVVVSWHAT